MSSLRRLFLLAPLLCASASAEVRHDTLESKSLGRSVGLSIHVPPGYAQSKDSYPLVVALHGLFESESFWERRGLAEHVEAAWARKRLPEFVLVAPDGGNSFFVDSKSGRYQELVVAEVPAWAERNLRVRPGREGRALLGISMGGYAALRIACARPEVYARVAAHSAMLLQHPPSRAEGAGRWHMAAFEAVFGSPIDRAQWNANDPLALCASAPTTALPALSFDCGSEDRYGLSAGNLALHEQLTARGVAHEFGLYPGDHGYDYVRSVLERSLGFLLQGAPAAKR
jgi:S-formylglutathione hydrolase FrmB